jgi:predicted dehydrogenase
VNSSGGILVEKNTTANISDTQTATFDYGHLQVVWKHRTYGDAPDKEYPWAAVIYGERGTLKLDVHKWKFEPRGGGAKPMSGKAVFEYDKYPEDETEKDLERHVASAVRGQMRDFIRCIGSRGRPVCDIEEGYTSTTACILANMSMALGRKLEWDNNAGKVVGDEEANKLLARPYRAPWVHPDRENV